MKNAEWNTFRASLHHDWMQKYMTFLYARQDTLNQMAIGGAGWRKEIKEQMLEWREKRELFTELINTGEEALSPRQLLYESPLNNMPARNREWLGEVIHGLYIQRMHIMETMSRLQEIFDEADEAFENLLHGRAVVPSPAKAFLEKLTEFSKAISKLPHNIQVV